MKRAPFYSGIILLSALFLAASAGPASAVVPLKINFQGRLDESGQPVDATKTFVFRIYDALTGGTPLWVSQSQPIAVSKGVFSAELAAGYLSDLSTPSDISTATFSGARYVEIVVDGQTLSPRQEIVSAPYALVAQSLSPDAQLPASSIADGSVTDVKVTLSTAAISSGKFSDDRVTITTGAFNGGFNAADKLVQLQSNGYLPALNGSQLYNVSVTTAGLSGTITDASVQLSTGAIISGRFGDDRVSITTAAVASGKFSDDRVLITTGAFTGGFNGADQLARLNSAGNLAISGGLWAASLQVSGALTAGGGLTLPVTIVTSTYTATANDVTLIINSAASGAITVELPSAVGIAGRIYIVKCENTNGAAYDYVAPYGSETIDAGSYDASNPYPMMAPNSLVLQSDGANWIIVTYI